MPFVEWKVILYFGMFVIHRYLSFFPTRRSSDLGLLRAQPGRRLQLRGRREPGLVGRQLVPATGTPRRGGGAGGWGPDVADPQAPPAGGRGVGAGTRSMALARPLRTAVPGGEVAAARRGADAGGSSGVRPASAAAHERRPPAGRGARGDVG